MGIGNQGGSGTLGLRGARADHRRRPGPAAGLRIAGVYGFGVVCCYVSGVACMQQTHRQTASPPGSQAGRQTDTSTHVLSHTYTCSLMFMQLYMCMVYVCCTVVMT